MVRSMSKNALVCFFLTVSCGIASGAAPPPRPPSAEALADLVRRLGAEDFAVREAATSRLLLIGRVALPALRRGADDRDPEVRLRCKTLIPRIDSRSVLRAKGAILRTKQDDLDGDIIEAKLIGKNFDDGDLVLLGRMVFLRRLELKGSAVTDAGLRSLAGLGELVELNLRDTRVTGSGFVHLKGLRELNHLLLDGAPIEDKSLAHLAALPHPYLLSIKYTRVTDRGLALLRGSKVWSLVLGHTHITDAGLAHVRTMNNLKFLYLEGTSVTIRGLKHLEGHEDLRQVNVPNSVSQKAWDALSGKLPKYGNWDW